MADEQLSIDDTFFLNDPRGFLLDRGYPWAPVATGCGSPIASHYLEPTAFVVEWAGVGAEPLRIPRNRTLTRDDF